MSRIRRRLSSLAAIGLAVAGIAPTRALASNDADSADGTVFIRLVGNVRILRGEDSRVRRELLLGLADVPVATGSGFIVSPDGWIITNLHVVSGGTRVATIAGEKVEITVDVQRIEVLVPGSPDDPSPRHFQASVSASDPDLDLAVLYVSGQNLPHVPLGDSDAITSGEPVRAIGYPFGEELEIAKPAAAPDSLPAATVSPGTDTGVECAGQITTCACARRR
jgi:S1-C subfamily serine protease